MKPLNRAWAVARGNVLLSSVLFLSIGCNSARADSLSPGALVRIGELGRPEESNVFAFAFAPQGSTLVCGGADSAIYVWDWKTGKALSKFIGHTNSITSLAFSPDGRLLASTAGDETVRIWEMGSSKNVHCIKLDRHRGATCVAFSPDNKVLAFGNSTGDIRILEVVSRNLLRKIPANDHEITSLAFSPDGRLLSSAGMASGTQTPTLRFWDWEQGEEVFRFRSPFAYKLAYSPNGRSVAGVSRDIHLWEVASGQQRLLLELVQESPVYSVVFSSDGKRLASAGGDRTISLWDLCTGKETRCQSGHRRAILKLAYSPDGKNLASASADGTIIIWHQSLFSTTEPAQNDLEPAQLDQLWNDLAGTDAAKAYHAIWTLARASRKAVPFLGARLKFAPKEEQRRQQIPQQIKDLNHDEFRVRQKATEDLIKLGPLAWPYLRQTLKQNPELEVRKRIQKIFDTIDGFSPDPEDIRRIRSLEILEQIADVNSIKILERLSLNASADPFIQDVRHTLDRIAKRPKVKP